MDFHNAGAEWRIFHSADVVGEEKHLAVANVGNERELAVVVVFKIKTRVGEFFLFFVSQTFLAKVLFPRSAERWI